MPLAFGLWSLAFGFGSILDEQRNIRDNLTWLEMDDQDPTPTPKGQRPKTKGQGLRHKA